MVTIGCVGTGTTGSAIAGRLASAGLDVVAWNRSAEPLTELVRPGHVPPPR
ncbi:NAD(P)-binding domain-containing protein [Streptomyces sp. BBFR51]|uniref:NAD(P)-binding domain-containing protein n=1 Tax=Streptomyces sp. BBFR51 TaxID=3372856 RepID=UPI0037DD1764